MIKNCLYNVSLDCYQNSNSKEESLASSMAEQNSKMKIDFLINHDEKTNNENLKSVEEENGLSYSNNNSQVNLFWQSTNLDWQELEFASLELNSIAQRVEMVSENIPTMPSPIQQAYGSIKLKQVTQQKGKGRFEEKWMSNFNQLIEFKQKYGHANATKSNKEYKRLGNWAADQRKKLRTGKMLENRFQLLNQIGFEWDRSYYFKPKSYSHN